MTSHREKKLIYHLTDINNLASIKQYGLLSRRSLQKKYVPFADVADSEILGGRSQFSLDEMVPFHFIPKSPFDYAVVHKHPNTAFALLCVRREHAQSHGWRIITRHPLSLASRVDLKSWSDGIDGIDWSQMDREDRDYEDHECRMVCMAEALSPKTVKFEEIAKIFVSSEQDRSAVLDAVGPVRSDLIGVNAKMFPRGRK
jgi:hypothetical protein